MKNYFKAPDNPKIEDKIDWQKSVFLAGSCMDKEWRQKACDKLLPAGFYVFDPYWESDDLGARTRWEYHYLNQCENILFFFSPLSPQPITLFEYGACLSIQKTTSYMNIHVVLDPKYKYFEEVLAQTEVRSPQNIKNFSLDLNTCLDKLIVNSSK